MEGYPAYLSVLDGRDPAALQMLMRLHSSVASPYILDCTWGGGVMWDGCSYQADVRTDIRYLPGLDAQADFWELPFADSLFNIIVFDPPHIPTAGVTKGSSKIYYDKYGITERGRGREGKNIIGMFVPFLTEARRVLANDGIVLAKIADQVQHHQYHWQQVGFVNACVEVGLTPCDMLIKRDPAAGKLISSKWKTQYHLRKAHCFWIVVRKGKCERRSKS